MTRIFEDRLNKKLSLITEDTANDIKDIYSLGYDRQRAEDMLYKTIGPLTDNPRWSNKEWDVSTQPPEDYKPGGPAPRWTPDEIIFAFAGNPAKLFKGGADSPSYGDRGGSPMWRAVMQIAKKFRKERDKSFIEDLYQNGMIPLSKMMKPGFDEGRSPFISYAIRTVKGAIENGPGASQESLAMTSDDRTNDQQLIISALKITDADKARAVAQKFRDKYPTENEAQSDELYLALNKLANGLESGNETEVANARASLTELRDRAISKQVGLTAALKITDPKIIRAGAEKVKGKYRTEVSYDKHPDNPYGHYSSQYYQVMTEYADALESGDQDKIKESRDKIQQLKNKVDDLNVEIRGASSGLGQAISNKDRGSVSGDALALRTTRSYVYKMLNGEQFDNKELNKVANASKTIDKNLLTLSAKQPDSLSYEEKKRLSYLKEYKNIIDKSMLALVSGKQNDLKEAYNELSAAMKEHQENKKFGVASMDAQSGSGDEGGDLKSNLIGSDGGSRDNQKLLDLQDSVYYVLDLALKYDLNTLLPKDSPFRKIAAEEAKNGELKGKMTVYELRFVIRSLGPSGANYPGKNVMRKNLKIPRDTVGWWQPGEDPEIEPLPGGQGNWNSIWKRGGYQSLGPTEIANELTEETEEFNKLGIRTGRQIKTDSKGQKSVFTKVYISNVLRIAKVKLMILSAIHDEETGLNESIGANLPPELFTDKIDRKIIVETVETMIEMLDRSLLKEVPPSLRTILEAAPKGWEGTVKAMKKTGKFSTDKDSDKPNLYAIANSMKNKGYKSHYKMKNGKPVKKKS